MIQLKSKDSCCGCGACAQRCPKGCIVLKADEDGFFYPEINTSNCIDCGVCEKVCPNLNTINKHNELRTIASVNKNDSIRKQSSSGGFFSVIAEYVLAKGGVVFGACFDNEWQVRLDYTEDSEGLAAFRGSKYVQARTGNTFQQCDKFLKDGRWVLFSGTPCQIAGLKQYLNKDYDNLLTVEVACHGVPSPKIWGQYIKEVETKLCSPDVLKEIKELNFKITYGRDKDELVLYSNRHENDYTKAFIHSLIMRPSCYSCQHKLQYSRSDLTIADFWGVQFCDKSIDDDKGVTLIVINTSKGMNVITDSNIKYNDESLERVIKYNPALISPTDCKCRLTGIELGSQRNISVLLRKSMPIRKSTVKQKIKTIIKNIIKRIKIRKANNVPSNADLIRLFNENDKKIRNVNFRDKTFGWKHYCFSVTIQLSKK